MKFLLTTALSVFTVSAFAEMDFNQKKEMMTNQIDQKMEIYQNAKSCISSATSKDALKSCQEQMKQQREEVKKEHDKWKEMKEQKEEAQKEVEETKDEAQKEVEEAKKEASEEMREIEKEN
jgi:hypothetical protein